ncbi:hypothetical protein C0995_007752 [Termitomyces sp. Mi166|nr:hypothetical protein C0995_007752 [Termitomyces sp. Mi166\
MYFPATFFDTLISSIFAISSNLVDITKYAGKTNGGYIVMFKSNNATHSFANGNNMVIYCYKIINACAGKFTDQCIKGLQANPDVEGIYEDGLGGLPRGKSFDLAHVDQANSLTSIFKDHKPFLMLRKSMRI